jgi:tripartite ATP-independent transporter DctP family solute receptor
MSRLFRLGLSTALMVVAGLLTTAANAQTVIKLAHDQPESSTHHQAAVKWKELVESRAAGKIKVQIFPASMLGSGVQMVEQLQAGAIEAASLPTAWVAPLAPSVQVLDLPFLFPNRAAAYAVLDGPTGAAILEPLQKVNIAGVGFWESGFKQFTGNFRIREPSDYQGHKIRTMPAPVIQEQFKAFGAVPTTISFGELYSALQQKVVDGQENPIVTIAAMRFFEVQKHMTLSDHGFIAYVFMLNKPFLDKLPKEQREILLTAARESTLYQRDLLKKVEEANLEMFRKSGMEIITLTPEQRAEFEKAAKPVYDWFAGRFGTEMLDRVRQEAKAHAK